MKVNIEEFRRLTTVCELQFYVEGHGCVAKKRLPYGYQFMVGCPLPCTSLGKWISQGGVYQGRTFWPWHSIHRIVVEHVPAEEDELMSIQNATAEEF